MLPPISLQLPTLAALVGIRLVNQHTIPVPLFEKHKLKVTLRQPMNPNEKEISAVTALSSAKRYDYFVKKVCDWESAWGLDQEGWATAAAAQR